MKHKSLPSLIFAIMFLLMSVSRFMGQEIGSGFFLIVASIAFFVLYYFMKNKENKEES